MNRGLSPAQIVRTGLGRLPEVLECRRQFANWSEFARLYAGLAEMTPPFVALGREGFTLEHREAADLATSWQIFCAQSYHVPRGAKIVLDLGANIGMFSIYAARVARAQRVIALEPVSGTFARLQANLARNALANQVEVHQLGVGGSEGLRSIDLGSSSVHACMFPRNDPRFESGQCEMITVTTLDLLFARLGLDQVDMCKMDCEGGEVEAILAASDETLRRISALSLEFHFYNVATLEADERELFRRIEAAGFRCTGRKAGAIVAHFERVGPAPPARSTEPVGVTVAARLA
ncbi:MAG: FkbM family methyltransferase [Pirellulales bacterium]